MNFGIFTHTWLVKPLHKPVWGNLFISYNSKPEENPLLRFGIKVTEQGINIDGDNFKMLINEVPQDRQYDKHYCNGRERAMALIFAESLFGPIQNLYDKTDSTQPRLVHMTEDGHIKRSRFNTASRSQRLESEKPVFIKANTTNEMLDLMLLMGRAPHEDELETIHRLETVGVHRRVEY